jgi:very-long-chain enoyl-CoA reductase
VTAPADSNVGDIKARILETSKHSPNSERIPIIQQELSYKPKEGESKVVLNDDHMPVKMLNISNTLVVKNLGAQMSWDMVFYIEYLGPILLYGLCYYFGDRANYATLQK